MSCPGERSDKGWALCLCHDGFSAGCFSDEIVS